MTEWILDSPQTIELDGPVLSVRVRIVAGQVDVVGTDGPARIEVIQLQGPPLEVRFAGGEVVVTYPDLSWPDRSLQGILEWLLPGPKRRAVLSIAVPATAPVDLGVVSAGALVTGMSGRTTVRSVSGEIVLDDCTGDQIEAQTVSGALGGRGLRHGLSFSTVSGDLTLVDGSSDRIAARGVSGDVTLDLAQDKGSDIRIDTVSGAVTIRLPDSPDLVVDAKTTSGHLDAAFDELHSERSPGRGRLTGTLGSGSGRLSARTVSGNVALLRRLDVSPPEDVPS
jgi:hypothetical protein